MCVISLCTRGALDTWSRGRSTAALGDMSERSTTDLSFERDAGELLTDVGEIGCVFRFSHSAGERSYEFFRDIESFRHRLRDLPPSTSVILFRDRQLALRGVVDDAFVAKAKQSVAGRHWTIARTSPITMGSQSWFHNTDGDALEELEEELRDTYCWGQPVAVGEEPSWHDPRRTIEALVPGPDGTVKRGVY